MAATGASGALALHDETPPRIDLAFTRGSIATLMALDRMTRAHVAAPV